MPDIKITIISDEPSNVEITEKKPESQVSCQFGRSMAKKNHPMERLKAWLAPDRPREVNPGQEKKIHGKRRSKAKRKEER